MSEEGEVSAAEVASASVGEPNELQVGEQVQQQQQSQQLPTSGLKRERSEDAPGDASSSAPNGTQHQKGEDGRTRVKYERLIKVLLTSMQAGALIGQGGSAVGKLQTETGTRIKVSNKTSFFPNTQFRVITVEGGDEQVMEAMKSIVQTVCFMDSKSDEEMGECILAVPSAAAPILIGKQGATVTEINKETGCDVRIAKQSEEVPGVRERLVTLRGRRDAVIKGTQAIIAVMFKDISGRATTYDNRATHYDYAPPSYGGYGGDRRDSRDDDRYRDRDDRHRRDSYRDDYRRSDSRDSYRGPPHDSRYPPSSSYMPPGGGSSMPAPSSRDPYRGPPPGYPPADRYGDDRNRPSGGAPPLPLMRNEGGYSIQVSVEDDHVGIMLGPKGANLGEIERQTATKIKVSSRGDFVPGTRMRVVTISGAPDQCEAAKELLRQRLASKSQMPS